jgi:hypothetical protein
MTALIHLEPQTLLRNVHNDSVQSVRHRAFSAGGRDVEDPYADGMEAVMVLVQSGDYVVAAANEAPTIRTCRQCGCTDDFSCEFGCEWAQEDLCTSCTGHGGRRR